jgi:hypothetical protein
MTGLLPIIVLGILIVVFAFRLTLQSSSLGAKSHSVTMEEFANAREALDTVFVEAAAIERIFSPEDMKFISQSGTPKVQRLFRNERKALAIQWLRKTQKQVAQLMDIHLRLAGYTQAPSSRLELKLTAKYVAFFAASYILLFLLWLRGPFKAHRVLAYTSGIAGYFCTIFSLRLQNVSSLHIGSDAHDLKI